MNETLKAGNQTAKLSTVSIDKDLTQMNRNSVVLGLKQEIKTRVSDILNIQTEVVTPGRVEDLNTLIEIQRLNQMKEKKVLEVASTVMNFPLPSQIETLGSNNDYQEAEAPDMRPHTYKRHLSPHMRPLSKKDG